MDIKMTIIRYDADTEPIIRNITNVAITRGWDFIHYHKDTKDYMIVLNKELREVADDVQSSIHFINFSNSQISLMLTFLIQHATNSDGKMALYFTESKFTHLI